MDTVKPTLADRMRSLKRKCVILQLVLRHERTPWHAKICGILTLTYALSPIDLVPDFIPVLGFLDDLSLISWFLGKFQGEMTRYRAWEATRHSQVATSSTPDFAARPATGDMQQPPIAELGHS